MKFGVNQNIYPGTPFFRKSFRSTSKINGWKRHRSMLHILSFPFHNCFFPPVQNSSNCPYFFAPSVARSRSALHFFGLAFSAL